MGAKRRKRVESSVSCEGCAAQCCRYIATQIDTPTAKRDYDYLRWYLLHQHVNIFIDHEDDWYIEFETPCDMLGEDNRCTAYETRPRICRRHGVDDTVCEFHGEDAAYKKRFQTAAELESWLDEQGVKWRFKKDQPGYRPKKSSRD
jgi:Fe-S-cluster containining protein